MLEQIGDFILTFRFAKSYPVGHQFFLDTPGTSCQEEFLLTLSKFICEGSSFLCFPRDHISPSRTLLEPLSCSFCLHCPQAVPKKGQMIFCKVYFYIFSLLSPIPTSLLSPSLPLFLLSSLPLIFQISYKYIVITY